MNSTWDDVILGLAEHSPNPYTFALWAFDWEAPELRGFELEEWQVWVMESVAYGLLDLNEAIQIAVTSGHGVGKSALVAMLLIWAISTLEDTRGVVTANTETQLKTKTWVEVAKWFRLFIAKDLFKLTATAIFSADPDHEREWRIDMVPWSERNTEAFAGLHNAGKRIIVVFDEASAIPDMIHEVTEGALTDRDTQIIWLMCGNPTRNSGRFREAHVEGQFHHRWKCRAVDSRSVRFTNKKQIDRWIRDYGEDSDFVRVRVLGKFPRVDAISFISLEMARSAALATVVKSTERYIIGGDVARFGDDPSVIYPRCGRDAKTVMPTVLWGLDTISVARAIAKVFHDLHAIACCVDGGGVGGGVIDQLRLMRIPTVDVQFGEAAHGTNVVNSSVMYANRRAEIWGALRDWLPDGATVDVIPGLEKSLVQELTAPTYMMDAKERIQLERKKDMKSRGVPSPNAADALACTFAEPWLGITVTADPVIASTTNTMHTYEDYDPYSRENLYAQ